MKDSDVAKAAKALIDAPYALGNPESGYDCVSMCVYFYKNLGIHLPQEFKGYSAENYAEKWRAGEGREELREYLMGLGESVQENYERAGDLLIFEDKWVFPGIYLGSNHFLAAYEKGVMVCPYRPFKKSLIGTRRLG